MWEKYINKNEITWKALARFYELEQLSNHKMHVQEIFNWYEMTSYGIISWEKLTRLYKLGKPIMITSDTIDDYITIRPEMLLVDVIKEIINILNDKYKIGVNHKIFRLLLSHPLNWFEAYFIHYDESSNKLSKYDKEINKWEPYDDIPLEMLLFDMLEEIIIL